MNIAQFIQHRAEQVTVSLDELLDALYYPDGYGDGYRDYAGQFRRVQEPDPAARAEFDREFRFLCDYKFQ